MLIVDLLWIITLNNTVKVRMESTFKTWKIYEGVTSPTSSNIVKTS